jgi:hypothetical protein
MEEGPYIPHHFGEKLEHIYRTRTTGWLSCAVHHSIPWPANDVLVVYDNEEYFLRGLKQRGDKLESACITIPFALRSDGNSSLQRIYLFASILGWFKRGYVYVLDGYVSGSYPIRHGGVNQPFLPVLAGGPHGFTCNFMPIVRDERAKKALAFWGEGLRLRDIHAAYSFLSFYKVIESQFKKTRDKVDWINAAIPTLTGQAADRVAELTSTGEDVGTHIYESCRCAVTHASVGGRLINPDIPEDRIRIAKDLNIIEGLAHKFIREVLSIPDEMDVYRNRDALKPAYIYLESAHILDLQRGGSVPHGELGLNGVRVSVNHWPHEPLDRLKSLTVHVVSSQNGLVDIRAINDARSLSLCFLLDFRKKKAEPFLEESGVLTGGQGGATEDEIVFLQYYKAVIGNGIIEVLFPNGQKLVCEVIIPVNIDPGRTCDAIDRRIELLKRPNVKSP